MIGRGIEGMALLFESLRDLFSDQVPSITHLLQKLEVGSMTDNVIAHDRS